MEKNNNLVVCPTNPDVKIKLMIKKHMKYSFMNKSSRHSSSAEYTLSKDLYSAGKGKQDKTASIIILVQQQRHYAMSHVA